jgi:hypothetical protein
MDWQTRASTNAKVNQIRHWLMQETTEKGRHPATVQLRTTPCPGHEARFLWSKSERAKEEFSEVNVEVKIGYERR